MTMRLVDARGLRCPLPVLRLARALREDGAPLMLVADDPIAPGEITAFVAERALSIADCETKFGAGWLISQR